ncbi:MAG TPA: tripartite tricarboxylate transporter permease, partial [Bacillota bacterium]|nr:tripartite tricarboxylate transporter permease [Bacillota bacterium]
EMFHVILAGGFIGCVFLLMLGLVIGPRISRIIAVPKRILLPIVTVLCVIGAFACNNRMFDVALMFFFGILGYIMRRRDYPVAPMTLALVLGGMMDSNFRRAVSLASSESDIIAALFGRPITIILLILTMITIVTNIPAVRYHLTIKKKEKNHV